MNITAMGSCVGTVTFVGFGGTTQVNVQFYDVTAGGAVADDPLYFFFTAISNH